MRRIFILTSIVVVTAIAATLEYSDSVGMPLEPALQFVDAELRSHGLRSEIRVIASGKILTAFSLVKMIAYGTDWKGEGGVTAG